ncbi:hypothetical protein D9756_008353 [Leucocoprinus leucothites]|uniref:TFIIS-type domain-containing protein n=1 Tax=Leucocoprinus leucothites TaxID=201217 RepID=A0A8H5FW25_9AGAR|nr:hypothetical protein D9756_008353 [Leucoagaricus leucothites]
MDKIVNLSKDIGEQILPTLTAFHALLDENRAVISSVPKKTFQYGDTERHYLDIYCPPSSGTPGTKAPVLFFIYGGGFTTGDRSRPLAPFDLLYACVGAFFALKGFITIIPDYRLAPDFKFPEAARDVLSAINWTISHPSDLVSDSGSSPTPGPDLDSLFISGHSAGAVHAATLLFHPELIPIDSDLRKRIKGLVLISGVYHIAPGSEWRSLSEAHWGSEDSAAQNSVLSLTTAWFNSVSASGVKPPKILIAQAQNEPESLNGMNLDYHRVLEWHLGESVEYIEGKGHNHISIVSALSSGEGEEWGVRAADWILGVLSGSGGGDGATGTPGAEILKDAKETDAHVCPKCQQRKTRSFTVEIGTQATPSKTYFSCVKCGNKWTD